MIRLEMKNGNSILTKKTAKISQLLSGKIDKYKYLTGEEILPFDLRRVVEQAKFTYSPLRKALMKQKKNDWRSRKKHLDAWKVLKSGQTLRTKDEIPGNQLIEEAKNEVKKIFEIEQKFKFRRMKFQEIN